MARESNSVQGFMPWWIADYHRDTQHLSRDQHGGYLLILAAYWTNGGPLPDSAARMAAIAKATPKEWKILGPVLAEFFRVQDGVWWHKRAEEELEKARGLKEAQRKRTEAATEARLAKATNTTPKRHVTSDVTRDLTSTPSPSPESSEPKGSSDSPGLPLGISDPTQQVVDAWNTLAAELGLATIKTITPARKTAIKARVADAKGVEPFLEILGKVRDSPFLRGSTGWRADFDFVLRKDKFLKLQEGGYDNGQSGRVSSGNGRDPDAAQRRWDTRVAAAAASGGGRRRQSALWDADDELLSADDLGGEGLPPRLPRSVPGRH